MALGTTNISITLIKNTLGVAETNLSSLCTSNNINMWSRYKPVRGTFPTATDNKFGFALPTSTSGGAYSVSNWTYLKPTTEYRLGDFRGYEHAALMPPIYSKLSNSTIPDTLYPSGTINLASLSFKANATNLTTRIKPVDLGLSDYYFGIKYKINDGFWYYKTVDLVSNLVEIHGTTFDINVTVTFTEGNVAFINAPVTTTGTAYYELVLCSSACTNWTTTAPTTVILLPSTTINGEILSNSGSINIAEWSFLTVLDMNFTNSNLSYQSTIVYTSSPSWYIVSKPSWINVATYRSGVLVSSGDYINGDELRIYPSSVNTGNNRSGIIEVLTEEVNVFQDGHNPNLLGFDLTGITKSGGSAIFTVYATTCTVSWTTLTGMSTRGNVYVRLFDNNAAQYLGDWITVSTINNEFENVTLTGFTTSDIKYGGDYTVYITTVDPLL